MINSLIPTIETIIDDLLKSFPDHGMVDLMRSFAYPLPVMTIGEMLGVAREDISVLAAWAAPVVEAIGKGRLTGEAAKRYGDFVTYFGTMLKRRTAEPPQILMEELMIAEAKGIVSTEELLSNCVFLLLAGRDTTSNLIGNGVLSLLRNPDQFERLRGDQSLLGTAVEELLRYESPVQCVTRTALEDIEVGCRTIQKGQKVLLWVGAANRDPARFLDPDKLDVARPPNGQLAFIAGVHYCLGAALARLEGRLVMEALMRTFRSIQLAEDRVEWEENPSIRALNRLMVRVQR
jgi:cytochrome P450